MARRIINILNKEIGGLNQAALLLGFFAIMSQLLALVRDRSLAHFVGPSKSLDVYYAAFRIPDFIFISIASLVSVTVLIPLLLGRQGADNARKFFNDIFTIFLSGIIMVSAAAFILMPALSKFIAPGFSPTDAEVLVNLSRIMLVSPILLGLSNLFGSVSQLNRKFLAVALSPVFYNIGIIIGVFFLYEPFGIYGITFGVIIGAMLHLIIKLPAILADGFIPRISTAVDFSSIKNVFALSLPRTLGLSLNNLALIGIVALASLEATGSISIFSFALNLQSVPLAIIGISYSMAAFPALARYFAEGNKAGFISHMQIAARAIVFWSLPISFLFIVLRAQIVRVILGSGAFSWAHTRLTAAALALFAVSILAQCMMVLLVQGYYAAGNTRKPLIVNMISSVVIIILAYVLLGLYAGEPYFRYFIESLLRVNDIPGTAVLMLPLAYSIGTILNFILLWIFFRKDFLNGEIFIKKTFFQSASAAFFAAFAAYKFLDFFGGYFDLDTFMGIFMQGLLSGLIGIFAGAAVLWLLKSEELMNILRTIRSKYWKVPLIGDL